MERLQPTPSKITKTCSTLQRILQEFDTEITHFTNSPNDSPSLDLLAQHIEKRFGFIRNLLNAEIASHGMTPDDSSEIEERITELEAKFYGSNLHLVNSESGSGSVCESCLNSDGVEVSSDVEAPGIMYGVVVPGPEVDCELMEPTSGSEKVETFVSKDEMTGGGKRRWWRTVAVLAMVIAGLMVCFCNYLGSNQHEKFLTPT